MFYVLINAIVLTFRLGNSLWQNLSRRNTMTTIKTRMYSTRSLIAAAYSGEVLTEAERKSIAAVKDNLDAYRNRLHVKIAEAEKLIKKSWETLEALGIASTYGYFTNNYLPVAVITGMVKEESIPPELLRHAMSIGS